MAESIYHTCMAFNFTLKVRKKAKIRNRYNQVPHLTNFDVKRACFCDYVRKIVLTPIDNVTEYVHDEWFIDLNNLGDITIRDVM